jgi:hypothetical protein
MKTNPLIICLALIMFGSVLTAQQTATLECDVDALLNGSDPADVCVFLENPDVNPEDFTMDVLVDEDITWSGVDPIFIRKIQHYGGTKIFKKDPEGDGEVKAKPNKKTDGKPYRYKIHFKINNTGKNYKIDPIIKVRNR